MFAFYEIDTWLFYISTSKLFVEPSGNNDTVLLQGLFAHSGLVNTHSRNRQIDVSGLIFWTLLFA